MNDVLSYRKEEVRVSFGGEEVVYHADILAEAELPVQCGRRGSHEGGVSPGSV
jgi:hypothetical protein